MPEPITYKVQLPEGSMESLTTTNRFVTLNCRTLSSELQEAALSRLLRYLCVPFAVVQEACPVISIGNFTIYCGDADERQVSGCAIAVMNDYNNLVEEFGSTSSGCAFLRLRNRTDLEYVLTKNIPLSESSSQPQDTVPQEKPISSSSTENRRGRKKLCRQLEQDRDKEWTSRAKEFEKACEDKDPHKTYALRKQCGVKMKGCSSAINTSNGVAVGEATLPIWRDQFKTLLKRQAPSVPELGHVDRPTYAVNEESPTESEVLVCIQKMKNGKCGGDDGIST
ncbi:hypothetical protein RB195_022796 [Necator americanus]|uniref:Uncharacterized protein n=1 Tax=Necator americanus TaxID=51031 RepID=A0ABR1EGP9_NECAM